MAKCGDPILCYQDHNKKIYRHFSMASPIVREYGTVVSDCRHCFPCRKKYAQELADRCVLNASLYKQNSFLTTTYDETREGYKNVMVYKHIQDFKKRLRSWVQYHFDKKIEVFNVHEFGANGKKHWHLVLFNHDFSVDEKGKPDWTLQTVRNGHNIYTSKVLTKRWGFGHASLGNVTEASAMYQAQYSQKDLKYGNSNDFEAYSKHSGIGKSYFLLHYEQILTLGYVPIGGRKAPVPRYFRRLAHKHWSHFYCPENFLDTSQRKRLYAPFGPGESNLNIAILFQAFERERQNRIAEDALQWKKEIEPYIYSKKRPDFLIAAQNLEYDFLNRQNKKGAM